MLTAAFGLTCHLADSAKCEEPSTQTYAARDTLPAALEDANADAAACLRELTWPPQEFSVTVSPAADQPYDYLVRFPSPRPSGDATNDTVTIQWHAARNDTGELIDAPAIVVVHESGSNMEVGRLFARSLQMKQLHALMIQLPYYGPRRGGGKGPPTEKMLLTMRQGIADVRRAYDAVAAIPQVDRRRIGLQGTSLGGFVSATSASLDGCYDRVFIMLAGGNLPEMIQRGEKDTAKLRDKLTAAGYDAEGIRDLLWQVEPTRVAHRLPAESTWLYNAMYDRVVPLENGQALADAIGLADGHHIRLPGNHYTTIVYFPWIVNHVAGQMRAEPEPGMGSLDETGTVE